MKRSMLACGKALGLLVAVYAPTFMIVSALIMPSAEPGVAKVDTMAAAVPLVIGISLVFALVLIAFVSRRQIRSYGFRLVSGRTLLFSLVLGLLLGVAVRCLAWLLATEEPAMFTEVAMWQVVALFWIGAPIQEEIIFRGLFQTTLERGIPTVTSIGGWSLSIAALGSAVIFSLVHLGLLSVGASWGTVVFIGGSALLLGVAAGQCRWRTGSLIPSIVIHALFNMSASLWP
jgi:membrane protease YdiL (CAAX protease family)